VSSVGTRLLVGLDAEGAALAALCRLAALTVASEAGPRVQESSCAPAGFSAPEHHLWRAARHRSRDRKRVSPLTGTGVTVKSTALHRCVRIICMPLSRAGPRGGVSAREPRSPRPIGASRQSRDRKVAR
jgi:hypothetical protein